MKVLAVARLCSVPQPYTAKCYEPVMFYFGIQSSIATDVFRIWPNMSYIFCIMAASIWVLYDSELWEVSFTHNLEPNLLPYSAGKISYSSRQRYQYIQVLYSAEIAWFLTNHDSLSKYLIQTFSLNGSSDQTPLCFWHLSIFEFHWELWFTTISKEKRFQKEFTSK